MILYGGTNIFLGSPREMWQIILPHAYYPFLFNSFQGELPA